MALRSQYENGISYRKEEGAKQHFQSLGKELLNWIRYKRVDGYLSSKEKTLHEKELGKWSYEDILNNFWRIESLKAVLWCTRALDKMPTYFAVGNVEDIYAALPVGKDVTDFLDPAKLRAEAEIAKERRFAQFLNWRGRTELLRLQGMKPPMGDSYEKVVARALHAIDEEGFPVEHDSVDILINGVRFIDLDEEKRRIMSICHERHLALDWALSEDHWDDARAQT